jgi:hypothetical protein
METFSRINERTKQRPSLHEGFVAAFLLYLNGVVLAGACAAWVTAVGTSAAGLLAALFLIRATRGRGVTIPFGRAAR